LISIECVYNTLLLYCMPGSCSCYIWSWPGICLCGGCRRSEDISVLCWRWHFTSKHQGNVVSLRGETMLLFLAKDL